MSLHAQLSPEAQARLQAQRRSATISAIIISLLTIALIVLILFVVWLDVLKKETPPIVTYSASINDQEDVQEKKMTNAVQQKPSAPSAAMSKVIAANTTSPTAVPVPEVDVIEPAADFGDGDDFGDGWGSGGEGGGGGGFGNIPATMRKRCSKEDRLQRLSENGGTEKCEDAVVKGLDWLKATQNSDGSWGGKNQVAMTGLAILAYLGHCETPAASDYADTVLKGITWLVDKGVKSKGGPIYLDGEPNPMPYNHAIGTYALGESATFSKQLGFNVPQLFEVTQKAGQLIIDKQHKQSGGWAYGYKTDGGNPDLSVSAWQIQALKACKHTGLDFKGMDRCVREALDFVDDCQGSNGGFGYTPGNPHPVASGYISLTGAGMLSFQMWDKASAAPVRNAARYIEQNSKFKYNTADCDLYGHYYESQAMIARGGAQWRKYNEMFRDELLNNQDSDGGWKNPGGGQRLNAHGAEFDNNRHYRSCLCILMLETYYRFLPGTGAGVH